MVLPPLPVFQNILGVPIGLSEIFIVNLLDIYIWYKFERDKNLVLVDYSTFERFCKYKLISVMNA